MRIIVTGGAGFIGSHVVDAYLAQGHDVAVIDDLTSGSQDNVNARARWYQVDIRGPEIHAIIENERPEVISHHAAQINVRRSVENPSADASVNIMGSLNLFEAARHHGVRRIVFASTGGAIYGEVEGEAADEAHPCRPLSPYAVAKLAAERYLDYYCAAHGLDGVILRYANVYGPRQDPHGEAGVVAIFMNRILAGLAPTIYGDGEQTRDFVYVDDVVRANLAALALETKPGVLPVFNVSTGSEVSVNELWRVLAAIVRPGMSPYHEPAKAGDVRRSVLDAGHARSMLGWTAEVKLDDGLRATWEWFVRRGLGRSEGI